MPFQVNSAKANGVSSAHRTSVCVLFADARVHLLSASIEPKILKAALTRNGGAEAKEIDGN
jgi:hypothetical protein